MSHVLLVEDSPTQALQMKMLLESAEHDVTCCDDGTAAVEELANGTSEIVVTDLELPVMNGLELIKRMQADFPDVPAVLVTGHGSERLAAEALQVGATAYVPKSMLDELLLGTVEDVLGVMRTDRSYAELIDCTEENRLVFNLPNKPALLTAAIDLTMQMAAGMQLLSGVERFRVGTALRQAASNAIYRGNLELTHTEWKQTSAEESIDSTDAAVVEKLNDSALANRKIHFDARVTRDFIRVVIADQGKGFDHASVIGAEGSNVDDSHGRGLVMIKNFMDKISFNTRGNEITLVKHCKADA